MLKSLLNITDEHAENAAKIANIDHIKEIIRFNGSDNGGIQILGLSKNKPRSLIIYNNGSDTHILHDNQYIVSDYCYRIYKYLEQEGYNVDPHKYLSKK